MGVSNRIEGVEMNAYVSRTLEVSIAEVITHAATQIDWRPLDVLLAAINEAVEMPDLDGDIGDVSAAYSEGEIAGVIALIMKLIENLDAEQINALKLRLPR